MKILFACHGAGNGGAERIITTLANEFYKRKYQVVLITTKEKHNDYQLEDGIKHFRVIVNSSSKVSEAIQRLKQMRIIIKSERPDCIISFSTVTNLQILISSSFLRIKTIVSERVDPSRYPTSKIRRILRIALYPTADKIIFQTKDAMDYFPNMIKKKGDIIPNPIRDGLPLPYSGERENIVVGVGSLGEQKNWTMALSACRLFFEQKPEYKMIIYGEGPLREELQSEIDNDEILKNRVILAGFADNVVDRIRSSRMYISSSNYEGISNSMLEALAIGLPTICTDCPTGGAKSVIVSGQNGFLVEVEDHVDLAEKMLLLANDDDLCDTFSENSVHIRNTLKLDTIVDLWEKEVLG